MADKQRFFISIYFSDSLIRDRKRRDVTVAFDSDDALYLKCKELGSSGIKNAIGIHSYGELVKQAAEEDRTVSNLIRFRMKAALNNESERTSY